MANNTNINKFSYIPKSNYDVSVKINGEDVLGYSQEKLDEIYPDKTYKIIGEFTETKSKDAQNDLGKIEFADKLFYVSKAGKYPRFFYSEVTHFEVRNRELITLVRFKWFPVFVVAFLAVIALCITLLITITGNKEIDPHIIPAPVDIVTISGNVFKGDIAGTNATISLQRGSKEISKTSTDETGKFLISNVSNGTYNLVCTYGQSSITKIAEVDSNSLVIDFSFPGGEKTVVKAGIKTDSQSTNISVGKLDEEILSRYIENGEVSLSFSAKEVIENSLPKDVVDAFHSATGELTLTYYDFSIGIDSKTEAGEESSTTLSSTNNVLEIAVGFDSTYSAGTYVFRHHDGGVERFEVLEKKPESNFEDGTCFIAYDTVYLYSNKYSVYAVGAAQTDQRIRGNDRIICSDIATINLSKKEISIMYKRSADALYDAKAELYLVGDIGNTLIAKTGVIEPGYMIEKMDLLVSASKMPSVGTYSGVLKIKYIDENGNELSTQIDVPIGIAITK